MTNAPHEIILASAGTGKTFRLARRYLQLLVDGNDHGEILATTFTRKAAREILARVMQWLAAGAAGGEKFDALTPDVYPVEQFPSGPPADWNPEHCHRMLKSVVGGLHRLQVRTLDSWFASLARLFGLELGLPAGWNLADARDDVRMRDRVLSALFADTDAASAADMLGALQSGAHSRAVHSGQLELLSTGLEILRDSSPAAWEKLNPGAAPSADAHAAAAAAIRGIVIPLTKAGKKRALWEKAVQKVADALEAQRWTDFLGETLVARVVEGLHEYGKAEIEVDAARALQRGIDVARWHVIEAMRRWTLAARELLSDFDGRYSAAKYDAGGYLHEDMPRLLVGGAQAHLADAAVAYRSDGRLQHLLLDEFQDTSVWQWRVLQPLLDRVIQGASSETDRVPSLFCVGDVKQSIYGWRQGEPRLLEGISDWYALGEPETMVKSWRSSQKVLDAVNAVFGNFEAVYARVPEMDPIAATNWASRWQDHVAAKKLLGGAGVQIIRKDEDNYAPVVEEVAARVATIHGQHPQASVGVLVQRRKWIPRILHELEKRGIRASGEGGSELTDSQSVQAALSIFRLAHSPEDTMAAFHLASGPFAGDLRLSLATVGSDEFRDAASRASSRIRRGLLNYGAGGFLDALRPHIDAHWKESAWEIRRFGQLIDLAHGFDTGRVLRPADFVAHVEGTPLENPSPSPVRVMTIHASKGLEFDGVVLPLWQETKGNGGRGLFRYSRPDGDPRSGFDRVVPKAPAAIVAVDPLLEELQAATTTRDQQEAYCVLYVAMTRARRRLDLFLEEGAKNPKSFSLPLLVENALGMSDDHWSTVDEGLETAAIEQPEADPLPDPEAAAPQVSLRGIAAATGSRSRPRWSPSGSGAEPELDGSTLFLRGGEIARTRGTIMHRLFEEIEWLEEFDEPDVALSAMLVAEGVGDGGSHVEYLRAFRDALNLRPVKELLRKHSYREEGSLEVWRERDFLVRAAEPGGAENATLRGSFDRVVLERTADGQAIRAHIIDFKTGAIHDADDEQRKRDAYRPQMEAYRTALQAMTGLATDAIRLSLLFVDAGQVLDV